MGTATASTRREVSHTKGSPDPRMTCTSRRGSPPVPAEFLDADTVYELEVLALEVSGNQTISVGFFKTA